MTKAQEVYEKTEALVAIGVSKAEAFRQIADELGQPFNSIRGAYYTHTRTIGGVPGASHRRQPAAVDPIEAAIGVLTRALEAVDEEVDSAKARVDEAQSTFKELRDSAEERKAQIKAKIDALNA